MNIIWVFLPPTLSFKDGFVRRWNQQSVALYRSRCNSPRWVKPSVLKIQYLRKTLQFKKGAEKSFFHASYHFFLQLYHGPDISTMTSWQVCRRACRHPQSFCVIFCQLYNIEQLPQKLLVSLLPVTKPQVSVCSDILATDDWKDMKYIWMRAGGTVQPAWPRPDRQNTERYDAVCFSYWSFSYRNTNATHDNEMKGIVGAVVIMRIGRYGAVWVSLQHRESEGGSAGGNCFLLNTEYWKINFFHLLRIMHIFVSEEKKCFPSGHDVF